MKLLLLLGLTTSMAFACPNFTGTFKKCTTGDRMIDSLSGINKATMEINHQGDEITASFMGSTNNIILGDTVETTRYDKEEMATINSKITAQCNGDILEMHEESKITYDWGEIASSTTDTDVYLKDNNKKIVFDMSTSENGRRNDMKITCTRI